jgi:hypothetical protein
MERDIEPLCKALRRNDPSIVHVNTGCGYYDRGPTCPAGWGAPLGAALLHNTVVAELGLNPLLFFSSNVYIPSEAMPMLCCIRSSAHLHTVTLGHARGLGDQSWPLELNGHILLAMAESPSIITFNANATLPEAEFMHFLASSPSIKNMELRYLTLKAWDMSSLEIRNRVVEALGCAVNIRKIHLNAGNEQIDICYQIIRRLGSHAGLQDLKITNQCKGDSMMAVKSLLLNTTSLQSLVLADALLDSDASASLMEGLTLNQSVTGLSLFSCQFAEIATQQLITFFQTVANRGKNTLCSLAVKHNTYHGPSSILFRCDLSDGEVLSSLLIRSSLQTLKLIAYRINVAGVLRDMTKQSSQIRLQTLHIQQGELSPHGLSALAAFISTTVALEELHITGIDHACDSGLLMQALQQNGSLIHVELHGREDTSLFNEVQQTRLRALSERNRNMPQLSAMLTNSLPVLPIMFLVAKQTPRTVHNLTFIGLLAATDHIHGNSCTVYKRSLVAPD